MWKTIEYPKVDIENLLTLLAFSIELDMESDREIQVKVIPYAPIRTVDNMINTVSFSVIYMGENWGSTWYFHCLAVRSTVAKAMQVEYPW